MFPQVEKIAKERDESFFVGKYRNKWFDRTWHYHPEYELILITKGFGTRVIGNKRSHFEAGDLVLIGGNIPHAWFSDASFFDKNNSSICESIYIQFNRLIFGSYFSQLPEMKSIDILLSHAESGLHLNADKNSKIIKQILELPKKKGLDRLLNLISILELFHQGDYSSILPSENLSAVFVSKSHRIKKIHEFVMKNYMREIGVGDIAKLVEMNTSSFCRYFKGKTNKTFSEYLKEIRIDYAQQLLINTNLTSKQIGYECGFNSVAYFNQCFKTISNMSPLEYRTSFKVI